MAWRLSWVEFYDRLQDLEDESYLSQDAKLVFPHWPDVTAYFTFFHFADGDLVAHARFDGTPPSEYQMEEASSALCYPAITWQQIIAFLEEVRFDAPKAFSHPAGIGFPPEFMEENFITRLEIVEDELVAVALYDPVG